MRVVHIVTLFAPEDAKTSANQIAFFPSSLFACGVPWQAHLKAYYHLHKSVDYLKQHVQDFDIVQIMAENYTSVYKQVIRMKRNTKRFVPLFGHTSVMSG